MRYQKNLVLKTGQHKRLQIRDDYSKIATVEKEIDIVFNQVEIITLKELT